MVRTGEELFTELVMSMLFHIYKNLPQKLRVGDKKSQDAVSNKVNDSHIVLVAATDPRQAV
jgi:hypothetical protein